MKQNILNLVLFFAAIVFTATSFSAENCLYGNPSKNHLLTQLAEAAQKSPITQAINKKYNIAPQTEASTEASCPTCGDQAMKANQSLQQITAATQNDGMIFEPACVDALSKIKTTTPQVNCPGGGKTNDRQCFTASLAKYQNAVISNFYKCVRDATDVPLAPEALFEIYSLESGFKPNFSSVSGVGIGQVTTIFTDDLKVKYRGKEVLNAIMNTKPNSSCDVAKLIVDKDLKQPLNLRQNECKFIQYGEGFERNVLNTIMGLAKSWKKDIEPRMRAYNQKHAADPLLSKAQQHALLISYGAGGPAAAKAAVGRLTALNPADFIIQSQQKLPLMQTKGSLTNKYTTALKSKLAVVSKLITNETVKADFVKNGAQACIKPYQ